MPIDGPLMAIDGPHGTAMAIDELRWDLSTGRDNNGNFVFFQSKRTDQNRSTKTSQNFTEPNYTIWN